MEDISVGESGSDASVLETDITDSDSYRSVDIKALLHSTRNVNRAEDNSG